MIGYDMSKNKSQNKKSPDTKSVRSRQMLDYGYTESELKQYKPKRPRHKIFFGLFGACENVLTTPNGKYNIKFPFKIYWLQALLNDHFCYYAEYKTTLLFNKIRKNRVPEW